MYNVDNNNYYNSKTPYYDINNTPNTPTYEEATNVDNFDKYKSITNVSQIPNYYIKQPNSNEFIIKCNSGFWVIMVPFFMFFF